MSRFWTFLTHVHGISGPVLMLLYPLYASVMAIESPSKLDDEQWLAYWILYSFLTLTEMVLQSILEWIPIWYTVKLVLVGWLVLPQFRGAAFIYERFVRANLKKYSGGVSDHHHHDSHQTSQSVKGKNKFVQFITPKKGEHEVY
ncbi:HVA22-like protein e [Mercurialis annua]|uniref:HVA22-like protein e n=1 Tax=Mercurialis annua TaxID=3986 RepID=UPI00215EAF7D|nr:HVA22-like protein e [Mercurialis annua]